MSRDLMLPRDKATGMPVLLDVTTRPSQTPARIKCAFVFPRVDLAITLPDETVAVMERPTAEDECYGACEFRLELN